MKRILRFLGLAALSLIALSGPACSQPATSSVNAAITVTDQLGRTVTIDGGYVMDASAIMQNDATIENLKAMTEATLEYGIYRSPSSPGAVIPAEPAGGAAPGLPAWVTAPKVSPGICRMWEEKRRELPPISGDAGLVERVWNDVEGLAYLYIWHVLLSF